MMYLWIKALHVAAVVTFIGGLLILSILLGALTSAPAPHLPQERRLMILVAHWDKIVTTPAMAIVWLLGITMAVQSGWFGSSWLLVKLVFVVALSALHSIMSGTLRRMTGSQNFRPSKSLRLASGFTMACTIAVALLVVIKPF
jgi:protoporphyrinogen IX oxidase